MAIERRRITGTAAACCALLLGGIGAAQAEPAVWVVQDADSTIYLLGTVHMLRPATEWKTPAVKQLVADSTELWLEFAEEPDPARVAPLVQAMAFDPERPLSSTLTEEQFAKLAAVAGKYGLQPGQLEPMKPWFVAMTLAVLPMQLAGLDPASGVDHRLRLAAVEDGDAIRGFETMEQQLGFLDGLPERVQLDMLLQTLEDDADAIARLDRAAEAWARGDLEVLDRELLADMRREHPELYARLLTDRNAAWAKAIEDLLEGAGTHLVAVGAGHLVGPGSVQEQLKARGIDSTPRGSGSGATAR